MAIFTETPNTWLHDRTLLSGIVRYVKILPCWLFRRQAITKTIIKTITKAITKTISRTTSLASNLLPGCMDCMVSLPTASHGALRRSLC